MSLLTQLPKRGDIPLTARLSAPLCALLLALVAFVGVACSGFIPRAYAAEAITTEEAFKAAFEAAPTDGTETLITFGADFSLNKGYTLKAGQNV